MTPQEILAQIRALPLGNVRLMEVCGTHTMAIARSGLKSLLPPHVQLLSGPGCPVCVTPPEAIDVFLDLSMQPGVCVTTYGDMLRVPGSIPGDTLRRRMARGANVRVVYSPVDALDIAAQHPEWEVVFLGVGFETTAPGTAAAVKLAAARKLENFSIYPLLRTVEPALRALLADPDFHVDGFICPGHVAVITGAQAFGFLPEEYGIPAVISGFEPEEILSSVYLLLRQLAERSPRLKNNYPRAVSTEGNRLAQQIMREVFVPATEPWRGLGVIPDGALTLAPAYDAFNAVKRFGLIASPQPVPTGCRCGDILCGKMAPADCPLFGRRCTPDDPVGPCMVSSEGACAAAYTYG